MKTIELTQVYQLDDHIDDLRRIIQSYSSIVVCGGRKGLASIKPYLPFNQTVIYGDECTLDVVEELIHHPLIQKADCLFAVGGGKAIDTVKMVAEALDIDVISFPTIASTCSATSAVSVIYNKEHEYQRVYTLKRPCRACFIVPTVLIEAPSQYLWAGIGDTLAKKVEVEFNLRGKDLDVNQSLSLQIAELCINIPLFYGIKAMDDAKQRTMSEAFIHVVYAILVHTGYVSSLIDYKYGGSLAHAINNALTMFPVIESKHKHGEVVAYGLLVMLRYDRQDELFTRLLESYRKLNLPIQLFDLDLSFNDDFYDSVWEHVSRSEELVEAAYPIQKDELKEAILYLESLS